ncbi:MAG: hypothetical protein ABJA98_06910 [Acidobacteriota bacterium]
MSEEPRRRRGGIAVDCSQTFTTGVAYRPAETRCRDGPKGGSERDQHHELTLLLGRQGRRRLDLRQRRVDELPSLGPAEHFLADGLHHMLRQDAAHHRELDVSRRIVGQVERRLVAVTEEGLARRPSPDTVRNACGIKHWR